MGSSDVATWEKRWQRAEGPVTPSWELIFREIGRHVRFDGKDVLDLGCGKGSLSFFALKAGAEHVTLVDFSDAALDLARELFRSEDARRVTYIHANLLDVNIGKKFDVVMSSGVAEHFVGGELEACVRQHVRQSRDKVAICVPSDTVANRRRSLSSENIAKYGFQRPIPDSEMRKLLERAGASVIHNGRFGVAYGMNLPGEGVPGMARVHQLVFMSLQPFKRWLGGLLLAIGQVRCRV